MDCHGVFLGIVTYRKAGEGSAIMISPPVEYDLLFIGPAIVKTTSAMLSIRNKKVPE